MQYSATITLRHTGISSRSSNSKVDGRAYLCTNFRPSCTGRAVTKRCPSIKRLNAYDSQKGWGKEGGRDTFKADAEERMQAIVDQVRFTQRILSSGCMLIAHRLPDFQIISYESVYVSLQLRDA